VCSTVDLVATLLDLCNIPDVSYPAGLPLPPLDGDSLATVMSTAAGGGDMTSVGWKDEAMCEYLAHGVISPNAMLRVGRYKLLYSHGDPAVLWDIEADPVRQIWQSSIRIEGLQSSR
jgi:choline-sulfatase